MPRLEGTLTQSAIRTAPGSKRIVAGRIISAVPIAFLIFDAVVKIPKIAPVVDAFAQMGYPLSLAPGIGILALICVGVYAIPRTSILGAVLLTGYLGGAVASQLRIGAGAFPVLFPIIVGGLVWGGLYLRDERVRTLLSPRI